MANTTNLNLAKPAGTDKALVSVLNSNSDKIDAWAGTTNQALSNVNNELDTFLNVPTETYSGDLNTLLTPGMYNLGSGATNTPPTLSAGRLEVSVGDNVDYVRQTYYGGYNADIFTRTRYYYRGEFVWNSWQQLALKTDVSATASKAMTGGNNVTIAIQNNVLFTALNLLTINCMITVGTALSAGSVVLNLPTGLTASGRHDIQVNGTLLYVPNNSSEISVVTGSLAAGTYDITLAMLVRQ
jgi:hypothetical protein